MFSSVADVIKHYNKGEKEMNVTKMEFRYFNGHQNLYMTADVEIPKFDKVIDINSTTHMHYGINEHGLVNFGIWNDIESKRPGHGGFWSSRESIVGPMIGEKLVGIGLNGFGVSIIKEKLEAILPEGYYIEERPLGGNETYYVINGGDKSNTEARQVYAGYQKG